MCLLFTLNIPINIVLFKLNKLLTVRYIQFEKKIFFVDFAALDVPDYFDKNFAKVND